MPVSVSLDAPSGRPGLVLRYLSAVSLDKGVLHNSLPQQAKPAVQGKVDFGENACVFAERRMRSFS